MSRKQTLIYTLNQHLNHDNQGSLKNRQTRYSILRRIIDDLSVAHFVPNGWHALTAEQVQALVGFWQKKDSVWRPS